MCVSKLDGGGPLVWICAQADIVNKDVIRYARPNVIVRCKHGYALEKVTGISQLLMTVVDECPTEVSQTAMHYFATFDEMMPAMWNACVQVLSQ
jgi:hypothetical protein